MALNVLNINPLLGWEYMINIGQDSSSRNNPPFVYIRKNLFYFYVVKLLSYSSFAFFGTIDLILHTNLNFDTEYNEP